MPRVIRSLIDFSQGHCYPPRPCLTGSLTVFANGSPIVRQSDNYGQSHRCGGDEHRMGIALQGSPNVFIERLPVHRDGDLISCGDVGDNGSLDVLANEGVTNPGPTSNNTIGYSVLPPVLSYPEYTITVYTSCSKFYHTGELNGGFKTLFADLYTPRQEEDTNRIIKDYTIDITNVTISPDLPPEITLNPATGDLTINNEILFDVGSTTYTLRCSNFVGSTTVNLTIDVQLQPVFGFDCQ